MCICCLGAPCVIPQLACCICCKLASCLKVTRWIFAGITLIIFAFSIALLVISSKGYSETRAAFDEMQTQKKFDLKEDEFLSRFRPQMALVIFYLGIGLGIVLIIASFLGLVGAFYMDRTYLMIYGIVMGLLLVTTIVGPAIAYKVKNEELKDVVGNFYKEFATHMYGMRNQLVEFISSSLDSIQEGHQCCGIHKTPLHQVQEKHHMDPAQHTIMFWLETTQWGQRQMDRIGHNESETLPFVPESCCKRNVPGCSKGPFEYHYQWNVTKEDEWAAMINTKGCLPYVLMISGMKSFGDFIVFAVFLLLIWTASIIIALNLALCHDD